MQIKLLKINFILMSIIFFSLTKCLNSKVTFVDSIPKSGTHLLLKCIQDITKKTVLYVVPGLTILDKKFVDGVTPNSIIYGHTIATLSNYNLVEANSFNSFFIYRDPRDQIVSMVYWVKKGIERYPRCKNLTFDELIMELICDGQLVYQALHFAGEKVQYMPKGINEYYQLYLPWRDKKYVYTTTFEKLIGPNGGGTQEEQFSEIKNIALHLGIELSGMQIVQMIKNLFGDSYTFRSGQIGAWKTHFKPEHKNAFKEIAGQLLIDLGYEKDFNW